MIPILFDGWPLIYASDSPAGLHLLALLERLPPTMQGTLVLPDVEPDWLSALLDDLPGRIVVLRHKPSIKNTEWGRLAWEQRVLPETVQRYGAVSLYTCGDGVSLLARGDINFSPAAFPEEDRPRGLTARLRQALGRGGSAQARTLWPADLPPLAGTRAFSPFASRVFQTHHPDDDLYNLNGQKLKLPENFVLYHGPGSQIALNRLLASWTWAAGPIGQVYPLVVAGLDETTRNRFEQLSREFNVSSSVQTLPNLPPHSTAALYQRCTVLFHPTKPAPWGDPLLNALACGKPVVSIDCPEADQRLGPAAYLAPAGDSRALGAALLSVIVEESVSELLSSESVKRMLTWEAVKIFD